MQHDSLAVAGARWGQRWSHGCQGEMELGCAVVGEGNGGAAGSFSPGRSLLSAAGLPALSGGSPRRWWGRPPCRCRPPIAGSWRHISGRVPSPSAGRSERSWGRRATGNCGQEAARCSAHRHERCFLVRAAAAVTQALQRVDLEPLEEVMTLRMDWS